MDKNIKISKVSTLQRHPFQGQKVDILIPFHGQYTLLRKLVESILRFTKSNRYAITLIDDCSPNSQFHEEIKQAPQCDAIRLSQQSGFGAAINAGIAHTSKRPIEKGGPAPYIVILNSDCLIQDQNWLLGMGGTLLANKKENVKLVSAKSNNPVSDISELKSASKVKSEDVIVQEPLPLFCAMCHRELFNKIQSKIKEYPLGYEDEYLFFRMKRYGYKQAISGNSWIYHEGQATIKSLDPEYVQQMYDKSREQCISDLREMRVSK